MNDWQTYRNGNPRHIPTFAASIEQLVLEMAQAWLRAATELEHRSPRHRIK